MGADDNVSRLLFDRITLRVTRKFPTRSVFPCDAGASQAQDDKEVPHA